MSFDWVERIEQRLIYQHYEFINCARNGYTAYHLVEKLKRVLLSSNSLFTSIRKKEALLVSITLFYKLERMIFLLLIVQIF